MNENDKTTRAYALVTGGSRGIGRAVSLKLAAQGYFVLVNFQRNETEADKTVSMIKEAGGNAATMKFDVSDKEDIQKVLQKTNGSKTKAAEMLHVTFDSLRYRIEKLGVE